MSIKQMTCPDVWINYNAVVHLLHGEGILHSETGKPKVCIVFQFPIIFLQILFMFKGVGNGIVRTVTVYGLDGLGFECWQR
jgi:hypothetical protein